MLCCMLHCVMPNQDKCIVSSITQHFFILNIFNILLAIEKCTLSVATLCSADFFLSLNTMTSSLSHTVVNENISSFLWLDNISLYIYVHTSIHGIDFSILPYSEFDRTTLHGTLFFEFVSACLITQTDKQLIQERCGWRKFLAGRGLFPLSLIFPFAATSARNLDPFSTVWRFLYPSLASFFMNQP